MEQKLFSWEAWDQISTFIFGFDGVVLKQAIGNYPIGQRLEYATLDYERGILTLGPEGGTAKKFWLSLLVGAKI